ncbi:integrase family protein [Nostoc sp. NIES-4103]|nr:integrase family protein [Nostoc sp. NIES-4103]
MRFRYRGKRYYISTGLADTPNNRKLAELKASEIKKDILCERLDLTLEKYQPQSALSTITPITPIKKKPQPQLDQLWDRYSEFKKPQISPSTYAKDFTKHRNHIAKLPTRSLDEVSAIRDYLIANLTPDAAKRYLTQFKACCNWAMEEELIDTNPFAAIVAKTLRKERQE